MSPKDNTHSCVSCQPRKTKSFSWLPAFLVAILPKCPFCIMAYAGAIPLCGGDMVYPNAGNISLYITIGLALIVLLGILLNYKGARTWKAGLIALTGIALLALSQLVLLSMTLYYIGAAALFFGIWYNGSFSFFRKKLIPLIANTPLRTKSHFKQ